MPAMKALLGIYSGLFQIVKVMVLKMSLFSQFSFKTNAVLNALIRRVNNMSRALCVINGCAFICNAVMTAKYL